MWGQGLVVALAQSFQMLVNALKRGGKAESEVWSIQQGLQVQLNHPGLPPTHAVGVRAEQFVTSAVIDTGRPQSEIRTQQEQNQVERREMAMAVHLG